MRVVERLPSGFSVSALRDAARVAPRRARWALGRVAIGLVLVFLAVIAAVPAAPIWATVGMLSVVSALSFVVTAGEWSIPAPSLVLDARPSWGGVRYEAWRLELDGLSVDAADDVVARLRASLDRVAGPTVSAGDDRVERHGWGMGAVASIDAGDPDASRRGRTDSGVAGSVPGIWLRVDRPGPAVLPVVTFLATPGAAGACLRDAAASVDRPS